MEEKMSKAKNAEIIASEWNQEESLKLYNNAEHYIRDVIQTYEENAVFWGLYISFLKDSLKKENVSGARTHIDLLLVTISQFENYMNKANTAITKYRNSVN